MDNVPLVIAEKINTAFSGSIAVSEIIKIKAFLDQQGLMNGLFT